MSDAVLLVPGFFGFGRLGGKGAPLDYFAGVEKALVNAAPALAGRIVVHTPPPTGSIDERVATLHDAVQSLLSGSALPDQPALLATRVHIVGHSAGGVDARLYANSGFTWTGGPRGAERKDAIAALGRIVTVSSPHEGTPIATNLARHRDALLTAVSFSTLFGPRGFKASPLVGAIAGFLRAGSPGHALLKLWSGLDDASAREAQHYVDQLVEDRQLMRDLTVESLEKRTSALRITDHPRVHCYVSVSPPPSFGATYLVERLLYWRAYVATSEGAVPGVSPKGPVIGGRVDTRRHDATPNDGVVPVGSQTLDGNAAGIVEGDHLDVVGHFEGGPGPTVFKSGAAFDMARFQALWTHVAGTLTMP